RPAAAGRRAALAGCAGGADVLDALHAGALAGDLRLGRYATEVRGRALPRGAGWADADVIALHRAALTGHLLHAAEVWCGALPGRACRADAIIALHGAAGADDLRRLAHAD